MKKQTQRRGYTFAVVLILCVSLYANLSYAKTIDVESKITSVTVFPDRALITRQAELTLPGGSYELTFDGLPAGIEEDSVNARAKASGTVKLYGAKLASLQLDAPASDRTRSLQEEINRLKDRQQELADRETILNEKRDFLASIKAASSEQIGKDLVTKQPSTADAAEVLNMMDREMTVINQETAKSRVEMRDIAEQIDRLRRELEESGWNTSKSLRRIVVDLDAEKETSLVIEISYRVAGANWEPAYEARRMSNEKQIQLTAYAVIRQNTGEDWQDISLKVSTAKPAVSSSMPEIAPWFIRKEEPVFLAQASGRMLAKAERADKKRANEAVMGFDEAPMAPPMQEAVLPQASIDTAGPSVSYTLPKKESLASDWQPKKFAISTQSMAAETAYEITPRLSLYAYLRAKVKNTSGGALLAGKVQIFVDDAFIGSSHIETIGINESFNLYMGIDEQIKVERKQLKAKEDVSLIPSLHGKIKSIDYNYLTTIKNQRGEPASIIVFDQVPVSQNDEIKVEQVFLDPKPSESVHNKPGVSRWEFQMASGASQELRTTYRLKYPEEFVISGLPSSGAY